MVVNKKVQLSLVGLNGNAFALMAAFQRAARRQGWKQAEIDGVLKEARRSDYDHLLCVLLAHCEDETDDSDEDDDC